MENKIDRAEKNVTAHIAQLAFPGKKIGRKI